ncbi:MAG TPA: hypothetical protein VF615_22295 [Longimicrobiaceae bacterium]|jgi:hypothetical protein
MRFALLVLAAALLAAPAHAQRLADATFSGQEAPAPAMPDTTPGQAPAGSSAPPASRTSRFFARAGLGGVGMVGGAVVVGFASYRVFPHCNGCEDPGFVPLFLGGLAGAVAGTAAFAALPAMGDGCSYVDRLGLALLGAGGGAAVGVLAAVATGAPVPVPVGTVGGSAWATLGCRGTATGAVR